MNGQKSVCILLVDDEERNIKLLQAVLHAEGYSSISATNGCDARELAQSKLPDLILLDMMMPGLDGVSTFERFKQDPSMKEIPIIFMTAKVQKNEVEGYRKLGAKGVIIKPFDPLSLAEEIMEILEE